MSKLKTYIKAIAIPLLVGGFIGLITSGSMEDFNALVKPAFAPPRCSFSYCLDYSLYFNGNFLWNIRYK